MDKTGKIRVWLTWSERPTVAFTAHRAEDGKMRMETATGRLPGWLLLAAREHGQVVTQRADTYCTVKYSIQSYQSPPFDQTFSTAKLKHVILPSQRPKPARRPTAQQKYHVGESAPDKSGNTVMVILLFGAVALSKSCARLLQPLACLGPAGTLIFGAAAHRMARLPMIIMAACKAAESICLTCECIPSPSPAASCLVHVWARYNYLALVFDWH